MDEETQLVPVQDAVVRAEKESVILAADELAGKIIIAIDMIAATIPDLRTPHPETARRVRGARTVSREAVLSVIAAVEAEPELQGFKSMDTTEAMEVIQSIDGMRLVIERVAMLQAKLKFTLEARWAEVVRQAMYTLNLAAALSDPSDPITAHVATIRRHLGRRNGATGKKGTRKKKKPKKEED